MPLQETYQPILTFSDVLLAISCQPGDVVLVSHDVPRWGESGRLLAYDYETNIVTLDRNVETEEGKTYALWLRNSTDDVVSQLSIVSADGAAVELLDYPAGISAMQDAVYSFGEVDVQVKHVRLLSVNRDEDMIFELSGLEYKSEVYSDSVVDYDTGLAGQTVKDFAVTQVDTTNTAGTVEPTAHLSWRGTGYSYNVYYRVDGEDNWLYLTTVINNYASVPLPPGQYDFCVSVTKNPYGEPIEVKYIYSWEMHEVMISPLAVANISATLKTSSMLCTASAEVGPKDISC